MTTLTLGNPVPACSVAATGGRNIDLADYRGQKLVLYFYPKDNTPGCTTEGQAFRDHYSEFKAFNTEILGVSRDSLKMHEGFKCKQAFPFELISDADEALCQLFDVIKMKNMYGKTVRGIERSTFLIDEQGVLVHEWRKVQVKEHVSQVLERIRAM